MLAMALTGVGQPLQALDLPVPRPGIGQVLLQVEACAVCRTDLHILDGELRAPVLPLVPGHEVVGTVVAVGMNVHTVRIGARVGMPWLGHTCGACPYCREGHENLCDSAAFTGFDLPGGYAEYVVAEAAYCFELPPAYDALHAAPLLCAGLIGHRAYAMAGPARRIGLYGFGAAAHLLLQSARHEDRETYVFVRPGDDLAAEFARSLGCTWVGNSEQRPPQLLDAALIFAPAGELVPRALRAVRKGGSVICAGIHMSDIPAFPYEILWGERSLRSVANLTRADGVAFFEKARRYPLKVVARAYPLLQANQALDDLRQGVLQGAAVLVPGLRP